MKMRIRNDSGHPLTYATDGAIGLDLRAVLSAYLSPGGRFRFDTGIAIELPDGYGAFVMPRSSLSARGITAAIGVIDRDYRGRIAVILTNAGTEPYRVNPGDRIAQLVIVASPRVVIEEVDELGDTTRGGRRVRLDGAMRGKA